MSTATILWHDYETWGVNPQKDFPCQFAGIRTDLELNPIDKPLNWFCKIPNDYLPHPQACLVTGITPQQSMRDGLIEAEFIGKIQQQFGRPGTCGAGYNSIRFDDEVTRYSLYRNFYSPYDREWQNGNSRWDIIDLVRACYALRPEGMEWVFKENGSPSFKLEELTQANDIQHMAAHDALSDVYATIALAKKIKHVQPKLFDFVFNLRFKHNVLAQINLQQLSPLVHISSKLPAINGCCTWIVPIAIHPTNKNAIICLNLALDPTPLFDLEPDQIAQKLYQPNDLLGENEQRLPIKLVHINKCPVIAPAKTLSEDNAERLGINREQCLKNLTLIKQQQGLALKLVQVFSQESAIAATDPDFALYSGGFFSNHDKALMDQIRATPAEQLADRMWPFEDTRLTTMLFRYRGRNYPSTLNEDDMVKWQRHRAYRLMDPNSPASIKMADFIDTIEQLFVENQNKPKKQAILKDLIEYAKNL